MMVVPWNCSMSEFREDGGGVPSIKLFARNNAGDLAQARDPEQGTDELVRPANLNRGAGLPELREHLQHNAARGKINARRSRHVDDQHLVRYGPVLQLSGEGVTRPAQLARKNQSLILIRGLDLPEDRGALGLRSRLRLPGRRRNLEGDRIVDRRFLELVLEIQRSVYVEQQRPSRSVGFDLSRLTEPLEKREEPGFSGKYHFLSRIVDGQESLAENSAAWPVEAQQFAALNAHGLPGHVPQFFQLGGARAGQHAAQCKIADAPCGERGVVTLVGLDPRGRGALEFHDELQGERLELELHAQILVQVEKHQPGLLRRIPELRSTHRT